MAVFLAAYGNHGLSLIFEFTSVHRCPPGGSGIMPCCGRTPFEVPLHDRITLDPVEVTCDGTRVDNTYRFWS
jgi:hypothetical protein